MGWPRSPPERAGNRNTLTHTLPPHADPTLGTQLKLSEEEIGKKRVKDLKAMMAERGLDCKECLEKPDFVAEVLKLRAAAAAAPPPKTEL